jgi:hypothetical protein
MKNCQTKSSHLESLMTKSGMGETSYFQNKKKKILTQQREAK